MAGLGFAMEILVALWLLGLLQKRRKRTYSAQEMDEIRRLAGQRDAAMGNSPALEDQRKPYRWWRYQGLY